MIGVEGPPCPACGLPLVILRPEPCPVCGGKVIIHGDITKCQEDALWACRAGRCGQGHLTLGKAAVA